jgi:hypothetical protein
MNIFAVIEQMHRSELQQVEKALRAQYLRLRREDPMVYTVKQYWRDGNVRFLTNCPTYSKLQFFAQDIEHSKLRLFTVRENARNMRECCEAEKTWKTSSYEVIEISKKDMIELPCYKYYRKFESYQPL